MEEEGGGGARPARWGALSDAAFAAAVSGCPARYKQSPPVSQSALLRRATPAVSVRTMAYDELSPFIHKSHPVYPYLTATITHSKTASC